MSIIYKELIQFSKKINYPEKKKELERYFIEEAIQMAKKHMQSCSTTSVIKKCKLKQ